MQNRFLSQYSIFSLRLVRPLLDVLTQRDNRLQNIHATFSVDVLLLFYLKLHCTSCVSYLYIYNHVLIIE